MGVVYRRDGKEKQRRSMFLHLLLWGTAVALLLPILMLYPEWRRATGLVSHLRDSILGHPYFSVREIKISGGENLGGSEIVAVAGLSQGMNIWKVDPGIIERKVEQHPWVKRVLVRREFPLRVVIEVQERVVKGIIVLEKLYYVDPEGFVFKEVGAGEKVDFPLLTGLQQADFMSQIHSIRERVQEALRLIDLMSGAHLPLSEIHFRPSGGVVLYPMAYPVALHMGWGDWQGKVQRLERVLSAWKGREDRLAMLDLAFRDQVVARIRKAK
ncbi:MAG: cell division protein FtsQ/DivIB [Candidatus Binatia bacterium]